MDKITIESFMVEMKEAVEKLINSEINKTPIFNVNGMYFSVLCAKIVELQNEIVDLNDKLDKLITSGTYNEADIVPNSDSAFPIR